ncbi:MAG: nuclear transport factor 2 family protein [Pseudomonadota bacterium]
MGVLETYLNYARDFEQTYLDDNWNRVWQHFHEHIVYEVHNAPVRCVINGRRKVCDGFKKALDGFDRRCERFLQNPVVLTEEGNKVLVHGSVLYKREDDTFRIQLWQMATVVDGAITQLMDIYDPGVSERYERWLEAWPDLDGAYV